jgi:ACS family hexuronate transporter-like MFS transporter
VNTRWRIAILVSAAIAISYLDRQTLPVAIGAIREDIPISNQIKAFLDSAFLVTYGLMYLGGGRLMDVLGTRRGFMIIMVLWSLACASHGLARNVVMLAASRLLLGIGEGGGFPAATRAIVEWFPVKERSMAMGIINGGTAIGAVIAPPLIAFIILHAHWLGFSSWRWVFFITGTVGLFWTLWWARSYFPPHQHRGLSAADRALIESAAGESEQAGVLPEGRRAIRSAVAAARKGNEDGLNAGYQSKSNALRAETARAPACGQHAQTVPLSELLRFRETWGIVTVKFLSDAAWYFYLFWLPKYLLDARGFDIKGVGSVAWVPYAAAGVGCLLGGGLSSWLIHRGRSVNLARKVPIGLAAAVMPCVMLVPHVSVPWCIALFSLAFFGHQWWSTLVMILPTDLFPKRAVGTVAGLLGLGGAMGGVVLGQLAGYLLDQGFSYGPVLVIAGSLHIAAFLLLLTLVRSLQPLPIR